MGDELVDSGERYFVILPPRSGLLSRAFQKLLASGIMQRWEDEGNSIAVSERVQDRTRVKSKTRIINDDNVSPIALAMEGKMLTVFLVWAICILGCMACLLSEILFKRNTNNLIIIL